MSCSRGTCFSALSWRRAPTKSRLMVASPSNHRRSLSEAPPKKIRGGHPRPRGGRFDSPRSIHPSWWTVDQRSGGLGCPVRRVAALDVGLEDADELVDEALAAERPIEPAVDEDGRDRLLERAREADPDVRMLRFAGAVDDAAHDRDGQVLDAGMRLPPLGHPVTEVGLDPLGHRSEEH